MRPVFWIFAGAFVLLAVAAAALTAAYYLVREPVPRENKAADANFSDPSLSPDAARTITQRIEALRSKSGFPALSVAIAREGRIVYAHASGMADLAEGRAATPDTVFAIASISKPLTAAAAMRLAERGQLDLDADIRRYVPEFPDKGVTITARQLLSHQSGIRDFGFDWNWTMTEYGSKAHYATVKDSLAAFKDDPLLFPPDEGYQYSSYGYSLLSVAMETAAGKPFLDIMRDEVFAPAGMISAGPDVLGAPAPTRARGYAKLFDDGYVFPSPDVDASAFMAGGGFVATPSDIARFGAALLEGRIVSPQTLDAMLTPQKLKNGRGNEQRYALGFRSGVLFHAATPDRREPGAHHGGEQIGGLCSLILLRQSRVVVAMCGNAWMEPTPLFDPALEMAFLAAG
jgi:CubicO group peptidase (beta-lactamase class C family)